jgi:hypothetical protein
VTALVATADARVAQAKTTRSGGSFWLAVNAIVLVAVAVVLRAWRLGNIPGLNGDEAWYGVWAVALARGESIAWWTPTGNPINLFFLLPLAALHTVFAPSVALLRSVAVASGILALAANCWLCRRAFDARTAIVSSVLLALLPINVAYSRFAWDASQSLLATVLVLYLPLAHYRKRPGTASLPVAGMIALAAAILVHPTNVFAAALVAVPIGFAWRRRAWQKLQQIAVPEKTWILIVLASVSIGLAYFAWHALRGAVARLHTGGELLAFVENYWRLFSGGTVYEYVSGVDGAAGRLAPFAWLGVLCKLLFGIPVVLGTWGMMRRLSARADEADKCLVLGWLVMLLGFFFVAGPAAIAPHFERYGICLVAPGAIVLARGLTWWIEPQQASARTAAWIMVLAGWLFPATFYLGYFDFIERTGGRSHRAFRTAEVEPKLAALRYFNAQRSLEHPARIVASEWWIYWPLAYLAADQPDVRVVSGQPWQRASEKVSPPKSEETWYIEFAGSRAEREILAHEEATGARVDRHVICGYGGQGVVSIIGPAESVGQNY